jgi:hypothetical protein
MSTSSQQNERNLEVRKAVRAHLAPRVGIAKTVASIVRALKYEGEPNEAEVISALNYLLERGHVKKIQDPDGGSHLWMITADGVNAYEAGN